MEMARECLLEAGEFLPVLNTGIYMSLYAEPSHAESIGGRRASQQQGGLGLSGQGRRERWGKLVWLCATAPFHFCPHLHEHLACLCACSSASSRSHSLCLSPSLSAFACQVMSLQGTASQRRPGLPSGQCASCQVSHTTTLA